MGNIDLVVGFTCPLVKAAQIEYKNRFGSDTFEDLRGLFIYNESKYPPKTTIFINVGGYEFKTTEDRAIKLFTKVATHEYVHYTIRQIADVEISDTEERFAGLLSGEEKWR